MAKTVRDVMGPEPWTIDAVASLQEAARLMRAWGVREVLVTDRGKLSGFLTDRDITVIAMTSGRSPSTVATGESCNPGVRRLSADQSLDTALDYMRHHELQYLPVVDDDDQLVGMAWITDLSRVVSAAGRAKGPWPQD